jgi:hypothetical protein
MNGGDGMTKGRYFCSLCQKNHNYNSKKGKEHLEYKVEKYNICPVCGFNNPTNIVICWRCGEPIGEDLIELAKEITPNTTNLQDAILRTLKGMRRAKTSTIAKKMQVDTRVIVRPLVNLRKKDMVKSKQGIDELIWTIKR